MDGDVLANFMDLTLDRFEFDRQEPKSSGNVSLLIRRFGRSVKVSLSFFHFSIGFFFVFHAVEHARQPLTLRK